MAPVPSKGPKRRMNHKAAVIGALRARNPTEYVSRLYPHIPKEKIQEWIANHVAETKVYRAHVASERKTNLDKARKNADLDAGLKKLQMHAAAENLRDLSARHGRGRRVWKKTWKFIRPEMRN